MTSIALDLLKHVEKLTLPDYFLEAEPLINRQRKHLMNLMKSDEKIYGVNTLVGHLDHQALTLEEINFFQVYLINNHSLPSSRLFSDWEIRSIGYTKAHLCSLGHTGISLPLYQTILKAISDEHFAPKVPADASYSCGDVIPGAHWAKALTQHLDYELKPKEGLSLINGAFIHLGQAVAIIPMLREFWCHFLYNSRLNAFLSDANSTNYIANLSRHPNDHIDNLARFIRTPNRKPIQDPISIRAFPQISEALYHSLEHYLTVLDMALSRPSDNPLIDERLDYALSQGSFVAPSVSIATGQIIEALMMSLWAVERRINFLLSGKITGIPTDGTTSKNPLGLIQVPKLITSKLEQVSTIGGRRTFASGSATSQGVEDFWSYGVTTLNILKDLLVTSFEMLALEEASMVYLIREFKPHVSDWMIDDEMLSADFNSNYKTIQERVEQEKLTELLKEYPNPL